MEMSLWPDLPRQGPLPSARRLPLCNLFPAPKPGGNIPFTLLACHRCRLPLDPTAHKQCGAHSFQHVKLWVGNPLARRANYFAAATCGSGAQLLSGLRNAAVPCFSYSGVLRTADVSARLYIGTPASRHNRLNPHTSQNFPLVQIPSLALAGSGNSAWKRQQAGIAARWALWRTA